MNFKCEVWVILNLFEFRIFLVHFKMVSNLHAWPLMPRSRIIDFSCCLPHVVLLSIEPYLEWFLLIFFTKLAIQIWVYLLKFGWISKKMKKHKCFYEARKPLHIWYFLREPCVSRNRTLCASLPYFFWKFENFVWFVSKWVQICMHRH